MDASARPRWVQSGPMLARGSQSGEPATQASSHRCHERQRRDIHPPVCAWCHPSGHHRLESWPTREVAMTMHESMMRSGRSSARGQCVSPEHTCCPRSRRCIARFLLCPCRVAIRDMLLSCAALPLRTCEGMESTGISRGVPGPAWANQTNDMVSHYFFFERF